MIKFLGTSAFLALALAATPASAQLLGGHAGGGLGGMMGGTLGNGMGNLGGSGMGSMGGMLDAPTRHLPRAGDEFGGALEGSTRSERSVDVRKGRVHASNDSSIDGTVTNTARIGDRATSGTLSGSASRSTNMDAQLIGTDAVRGATRSAVGTTRDAAATAAGRTRDAAGAAVSRTRDVAGATVSRTRDVAGAAVSRTRDAAGTAVERTQAVAGNAAGRVQGTASGAVSQARSALPSPAALSATANGAANGAANATAGRALSLASAGSAAAQGNMAFPVSAGMPVTDARGKVIGTVQSVRSNASGTVEQVLVRTKKGTATLPATNFTGSGSALVSAMGKGEVNNAAE